MRTAMERARAAKKMSRYALAKRVGTTPAHITALETKVITEPRVGLALLIAKALDTDVETLFDKSRPRAVTSESLKAAS